MTGQRDTLAAALAWLDAGCAVLPVRTDGSKAPALAEWKPYTRRRPNRDQVTAWFAAGHPGLGVVCGAVSGGLEMLELEGRAVSTGLLAELRDLATESGLGTVWRRLAGGYAEHTPSGGLHLLYRVDWPTGTAAPGNTVLARDGHGQVLAETRGEGGFVVVAPSNGSVHPSGRPWAAVAGHPGAVATLTADEREALHAVVRSLDRGPPPDDEPDPPAASKPARARDDGLSPGDDFEQRTDWPDILGPHGWTLVTTRGSVRYWRRPGKNLGVSATTGRAADRDRLYLFSTSTAFTPGKPYTKFGAYAVLEYGGDFRQAAAELVARGYGTPLPISPPTAPEQATGVVSPPDSPADAQNGLRAGVQAGTRAGSVPPLAGYGPSEDGLARAFVDAHAATVRFCPQRGRWLAWDAWRWRWDDAETVREHTRSLARRLPEQDGWRGFKRHALSAAGVAGVLRLAQTDARIVVHLAELDAQPWELNTPAGVVDLHTGQLHPPDPARLHTRTTAVAPDFDRRSKVFDAFLADTFGGDSGPPGEPAGYVQRLFGISAVGAVVEQVLPFAHGTGANGKTTLLEACMHALGRGEGGYAIAAPAEMLMVRRHQEHPAELAQLAGARLVVCSELEDGQRFAESRVKLLTGRDSVNARFMRRDPFTFTPSHTLWLAGNHKPAATSGGPAFWRRVRLIPFNHVVPEARRDPRLGDRLEADAPAVLAWIIAGAADHHAAGLREPATVKTATEAYARDQDTVGRFIDETCHLAPGNDHVRAVTGILREAYERWCFENGETPASAKRLTQELRDRFGVADTRGGKGRRLYTGIALLTGTTGSDNREDDGDGEEPGSREWYR